MRIRSLMAAGAAVMTLGLPAVSTAATRVVDNDKVQCPSAEYSTIHAAVEAAAPNDVITVCTGVYRGGAGIGKAGIKLRASGRVTVKGSFLVGASNVEVKGFRIRGPYSVDETECGFADASL